MTFKPSKPISAVELMRRLQSDPEWARENAKREAEHWAAVEKRRHEIEPEEIPLLAKLAAVGIHIDSIWDLVNAKWAYPEAIPVLAVYLGQAKHPVLREGIARALTVPEARGVAGRAILTELQRPLDQSPHAVRWVLANALTVVGDESMEDAIRALISDDQYSDVRERLSSALAKLRRGA
ncbi:MAG: hypothetical protein P4M07_22390 [Xanthobacteraceae bacterium]|nr:hypothetical protein [Xanthobacteraceae bacterium]